MALLEEICHRISNVQARLSLLLSLSLSLSNPSLSLSLPLSLSLLLLLLLHEKLCYWKYFFKRTSKFLCYCPLGGLSGLELSSSLGGSWPHQPHT